MCARIPTLSYSEKILLLVLNRGIRERMWRASIWSIGVFLPLWRRVRDSQVSGGGGLLSACVVVLSMPSISAGPVGVTVVLAISFPNKKLGTTNGLSFV